MKDEYNLTVFTGGDPGKTLAKAIKCPVAKIARNPQGKRQF